ncbi:MAG: thymidylate synthase [Promethearchaeota archaeon]|jgi:thymidylate synthase
MNKKLKPVTITGTTISDTWFQAIYKCLEVGEIFTIDQGSYQGDKRLEFDYFTAHITHPGDTPVLPVLPAHYNMPDPVDPDYINDYLPYLMTDELKEGESYTYGNRLNYTVLPPISSILDESSFFKEFLLIHLDIKKQNGVLSQVDLFIKAYKKNGERSNQRILQIAQPSDCLLKDPPCLRHIDTRIQDGKLHFFPYFRSWDLWGGFPANLQAIQMLKKHMADEIGVEDGEMIVSSKGLHLYSYVWELAELIRGKTIEEFRKENKK